MTITHSKPPCVHHFFTHFKWLIQVGFKGFTATLSVWNLYIPILLFCKKCFKLKITFTSTFWKFSFLYKFQNGRSRGDFKTKTKNTVGMYFLGLLANRNRALISGLRFFRIGPPPTINNIIYEPLCSSTKLSNHLMFLIILVHWAYSNNSYTMGKITWQNLIIQANNLRTRPSLTEPIQQKCMNNKFTN